jgi:hypothetical protein
MLQTYLRFYIILVHLYLTLLLDHVLNHMVGLTGSLIFPRDGVTGRVYYPTVGKMYHSCLTPGKVTETLCFTPQWAFDLVLYYRN